MLSIRTPTRRLHTRSRAARNQSHKHELKYAGEVQAPAQPSEAAACCDGRAGEAGTLVLAMRLRAAFGGMPGDVHMLHGFADLWAARRAPLPPVACYCLGGVL